MESHMRKTAAFKKCHNCGYEWKEREELLTDPAIELLGYQVDTIHCKDGLILFNHRCQTTLAIKLSLLGDLCVAKICPHKKNGRGYRPSASLRSKAFPAAPQTDQESHVSEILKIVRAWPKRVTSQHTR